MDCRSKRSKQRSKEGFVLIATCIVMVILMAMAGLAVDIGRMYVIKSELQAFADAAALSAALQLDGSEPGLTRAREAAAQLANGPNAMKWDMGTQPITGIAASFAKGDTSPDPKTWQPEPGSAGDYHFVRVIASAPAPLIFLRAFQSFQTDITASGVASKTPTAVRLLQ